MRLYKPFLLFFTFLLFIGFTTCGIDEYYYLPQISEGNITLSSVNITLPALDGFYYATNYTIFYKIYLSNTYAIATINRPPLSTDFREIVSPQLLSDWNGLAHFLDTTTTNVPSRSDFSGRGYFELNFETSSLLAATTSSRNLTLTFHTTESAEVSINNINPEKILRNNSFAINTPNRDFFSTPELRTNEGAGMGKSHNHDVSPIASPPNPTAEYAYVCMFILATGTNPTNFQLIYSKPTYLGVFLLQPANP